MTYDEDGSGSESRALTTLLDVIDFVFCIFPLAMMVLLSIVLAIFSITFVSIGVSLLCVAAGVTSFWILRGVFIAASTSPERPMPLKRRISVCARLVLLMLICLVAGAFLIATRPGLSGLAYGVGVSFPAMIAVRHLLLIYLGLQKEKLRKE